MSWHFEVRHELDEVSRHLVPRFVLTNGADVEIYCYGARNPVFRYCRHGLSLEMYASRDLRKVPQAEWPKSDIDFSLGPTCRLLMNKKIMSRELTADECPRIAADFKAALKLYLELPGSMPPAIERVTFKDSCLAPYSD